MWLLFSRGKGPSQKVYVKRRSIRSTLQNRRQYPVIVNVRGQRVFTAPCGGKVMFSQMSAFLSTHMGGGGGGGGGGVPQSLVPGPLLRGGGVSSQVLGQRYSPSLSTGQNQDRRYLLPSVRTRTGLSPPPPPRGQRYASCGQAGGLSFVHD